ncbi:MAG: hypothetical protein Q4F84_09070 [Fibrobacter sp.]|nr:hypothetical protein [Fibrobacter sp.]
MKNKSLAIILTAVLALGMISCNKPAALKKAIETENSGNLLQALSIYAQALVEIAPKHKFPEINRSKIVEPAAWKKIIEQYFSSINSSGTIGSNVQECFSGIERCMKAQNPVNSLTKVSVTPLTEEQYGAEWNKAFFVPTVSPDQSFKPLVSGNYIKKVSAINLTSSRNYSYDLNLVNKKTGKITSFQLYPESSIRIVATPGEYLLICRTTVTFATGEIWRSTFEIIPLTVPEEVSLISGDLKTDVYRQK